MVGYNVDFAVILWHQLHGRAFVELTNLSFLCMIHRLCDKADVFEISSVDERVLEIVTVHTRTIKGLECPSTSRRERQQAVVPWAQSKGTTISIKPTKAHQDDAGVIFEMEIGEKREALYFSMQGEGEKATSSLALTLNSEPVGASTEPTNPSITAPTLGIITISNKFLQRLVDKQRDTNDRVRLVETKMDTLYEQIKLGVMTRFVQEEA